MAHRILIADPDEAFGSMLKQMLEMNGDYIAEHVTSGELALATVKKAVPELIIIDLTITDITPLSLINTLRQSRPGLRIMVIPLGDSLPDDIKDIEIQGVLTKPFFIGDLGEQIATALGTEVKQLVNLPPPPEKKAEAPARPRVRQVIQQPTRSAAPLETKPISVPPAPSPSVAQQPSPTNAHTPLPSNSSPRVRQIIQPPTRSSESARRTATRPVELPKPRYDPIAAIDKILISLAHETRADALLVLQNETLITQRSSFPAARTENLIELIKSWSKLSCELAAFVGEAYGRFQQLHFEGERYHVYAFDQGNGVIIVVVSRTDVNFGTVRLNTKAASAEIAKHLR